MQCTTVVIVFIISANGAAAAAAFRPGSVLDDDVSLAVILVVAVASGASVGNGWIAFFTHTFILITSSHCYVLLINYSLNA
jgi:hypothetical protein